MGTVCILDYGSGNVQSVKNALNRIGVDSVISNSINTLEISSHIILPGVGAFREAMKRIKETLPLQELENQVLKEKKPFLGICVGMQVLSRQGHENGISKGLGWIQECEVMENTKKVRQPHIGWNSVSIRKKSLILDGIPDNSDFYFVHSFVIKGLDSNSIIGITDYGSKFPSIIQLENVFGVQFHPEKSQGSGLRLLKNFYSLV